jgi:hypothetical protein
MGNWPKTRRGKDYDVLAQGKHLRSLLGPQPNPAYNTPSMVGRDLSGLGRGLEAKCPAAAMLAVTPAGPNQSV